MSVLNDHLLQDLQESGKKHDKSLNDLLSRVRAAQIEVQEERSRQRPTVEDQSTSTEQVGHRNAREGFDKYSG